MEVKVNGFSAAEDHEEGLNIPSPASDFETSDVPDVASIEKVYGAIDSIESEVPCDVNAEDLDMVADSGEMGHAPTHHSESSGSPKSLCAAEQPSLPEPPDATQQDDNVADQALGIPQDHDRGTVVQDVPKDPVSNYKKQKQAERNNEQLGQLQQAGDPSQFVQNLTSAKLKKKSGDGLVVFLGAGNDPKSLQKTKGVTKTAETEISSSNESDGFKQMLTYETFQKLIQRAVEGGTLHCLATLEGKHFILQSMIESAFPDADIDERLPASYMERRSTRAGTILLVPVAALAND